MQISFSKYVGCGNDFILIDNRLDIFPRNNIDLITHLCNRHRGIGADGIILLENATTHADVRMRIFNADGSEAEMCGNGIRCLGRFLQEIGIPGPVYKIQTLERHLNVQVNPDKVTVEMGIPTDIRWSIPLKIDSKLLTVHYLNTGVPHTIFFVDDVNNILLEKLGPVIRNNSEFSPKGTNVNLVSIDNKTKKITIRTYERGVEGETLACGTGATAAALASAELFQIKSPIQVLTKAGEELEISFELDQNEFSNVKQSGPASHIFSGTLSILE